MKNSVLFVHFTLFVYHTVASIGTIPSPEDDKINTTHLLRHYINVCGFGYLCDDTIDDHSKYVTKARFPNCPPCFCDDMCYFNGKCCPDKYFGHYQPNKTISQYSSLRSVLFFEPFNKEQEIKMEFVDKCPFYAPSNQRQKCEKVRTPLERVFAPPCTSVANKRTFWNKFCAKCHGEEDADLECWRISLSEYCNTSVFYVPTMEEVLQIVQKDLTCLMMSTPHHVDVKQVSLDNHVNDCRDSFNERDVMKACMSMYNLKYRNYKNIFCAMCNPFEEIDDKTVISTCNVQSLKLLGMSKKEIYALENRCNISGIYALTYPYKNVFCYLCNMRISHRTRYNADVVYYSDLKTVARESILITEINKYIIYIKKIKPYGFPWLKDYISNAVIRSNLNFYIQTDNVVSLNITRLERLYTASHSGCQTRSKGMVKDLRDLRPCQNDARCLFERPDLCCFETLLKTSVGFIHTGTENKRYLVINDCYNEEILRKEQFLYFSMKYLCKNEVDFPIELNKKSYRNIYCLLCNEDITNLQSVHPWSVSLECPTEIPLLYFVDGLPNLLKEARRHRCHVVFDTSQAYECLHTFSPCTYHGDHDVVTACERMGIQYFDQGLDFCESCRQQPISGTRIFNCSLDSIYYEEKLRRNCDEFPEVNNYKLGQYKNRFCLECNAMVDSPKPCTPMKRGSNFIEILTPGMNFRPLLLKLSSTSTIWTWPDAAICYPGRIWSGGSCKPLLDHVTRGMYVWHRMVHILVEGSTKTITSDHLMEIKEQIDVHLYMSLWIRPLNLTLTPFAIENSLKDKYLIKAMLLIKYDGWNILRDNYERKLINIKKFLVEFEGQKSLLWKKLSIVNILDLPQMSLDALSITYLPSVFRYLEEIKKLYEQISPPVNFVSKLLFCEHKVIKGNYEYDEKSLSIKLQSGLSIPVGQFIRWNGHIQVCKSSVFQSSINRNKSIYQSSSNLTNVSVIISYLSLGMLTSSFLVHTLIILSRKSQSLSIPYLCRLTFFLIADIVVCILSEQFVPSGTVCCAYGVLHHYFTLLVALSLYFYGRSIIFEYETTSKSAISFSLYYKVIIIVPLVIIISNSILMKVAIKDFGYCMNTDVCYLHVIPPLILSTYLPDLLIVIGLVVLYIQYTRNNSSVNRIHYFLFFSLVIFLMTGWIFEALITLKYLNIIWLKSVAFLLQSIMNFILMCYTHKTFGL